MKLLVTRCMAQENFQCVLFHFCKGPQHTEQMRDLVVTFAWLLVLPKNGLKFSGKDQLGPDPGNTGRPFLSVSNHFTVDPLLIPEFGKKDVGIGCCLSPEDVTSNRGSRVNRGVTLVNGVGVGCV